MSDKIILMNVKDLLDWVFQVSKRVRWPSLLITVALMIGLIVYSRSGIELEDLFPEKTVGVEVEQENPQPDTTAEVEAELHNPIYEIGAFEYDLEIVDTPEERQQGLSDRPDLPPKKGMLFVFQTADDYGIWMKDMHFPLDIIWLNSDRQVVGLEENVQPDSYPDSFRADAASLYIIEINAGETADAGLEIGDTISCRQVQEEESDCFPNSRR